MISLALKRILGLERESVAAMEENGSLHTFYDDILASIVKHASRDAEVVDALQDKVSGPRSTKVTERIQQLLGPMSLRIPLIERRRRPSCRFLQSTDLI